MNQVRKEDIQSIISRVPYKKLENKSILITGANGFMASYIVDTLMYLNHNVLSSKCKVIALCRNYQKAKKCFEAYFKDTCFKLLLQGVEEKIELDEKVDYVFHAAGSSASATHKAVPADILKSNIVGTYNTLEYAKENSISSFLFFSSGAAYGEVPQGITEIREDDYFAISTNNYYSEAKHTGEVLCQAYWQQHQVPAKCVRIGHTYGPGIDLNDGHVYSDFVKSICMGKDLEIYGDGTAVRQFCYIVDAVVGFFLILLDGDNGEVYNLANKNATLSIRELAELLVNEVFADRKLKMIAPNLVDYQKDKIELVTARLEQLGWSAAIGVKEGFQRTVKSFEEEGMCDGDKKL